MNNTEKAKAKIGRAAATFFVFILLLFSPSAPTLAASNDLLCAYCPELCGSHSGNPISSNEYFYCQPGPGGSNTFTLCKNQPCSVYEKYAYDSQQLYLIEDTSWATESGPVRCSDSGQLAYYRTYGQGTNPMPWISRNLVQGGCLNRSGTVVGYEKGTNRQCPTPYSGSTSGEMCLTYEGCIVLPNGVWTENGLILTIGGGAGAGENFYFDSNRGWIGFDRGGGVNGNFITESIGAGAAPANCLKISQGTTFGACQAEQPFPGGAETKGESFVYQANCLTSAQGAVNAVIKTLRLNLANNQPIADELKESLDKLKPYGYNPQVKERTALGKITFDVCEEGTTNWYKVENEVEFMTPAWVEKMTTEGKELASWLAPGGGSVMGEQTTNNLLAQGTGEVGNIPHGCFYWYSQNPNDPTDCSCMNDIKPNGEPSCRGEHSGPGCCPPHGFWGICGWTDCQPQTRPGCSPGDLQNACPGWVVGGGPQPTPTPKICTRYTPEGDTVAPESVCVAGNCQLKGITVLQQIQEWIAGVLTSVCKGKTFIITPKVQTPFVQDADNFLRQQTLSIFKVPGADAEDAFTFEHALENANHETQFSPPTSFSSETEIYGQRGVKDSYDWVQNALMPPGYSQY